MKNTLQCALELVGFLPKQDRAKKNKSNKIPKDLRGKYYEKLRNYLRVVPGFSEQSYNATYPYASYPHAEFKNHVIRFVTIDKEENLTIKQRFIKDVRFVKDSTLMLLWLPNDKLHPKPSFEEFIQAQDINIDPRYFLTTEP